MSGPWAAAVLVLWVLVMVLAVLVLGLLRRVGPALERAERAARMDEIFDNIDGLPPGSPVPPFAVEVDGRKVDVADVGPAAKVMLFVDEGCPACTTLTQSLSGFPGVGDLPMVVVAGQDTAPRHYADLAAAGLLVVGQPDGAATAALGVRAFPYAVAVAAEAR